MSIWLFRIVIIVSVLGYCMLFTECALDLFQEEPKEVVAVEGSTTEFYAEEGTEEFDEALELAKKIHRRTKRERDIYAERSAKSAKTLNKVRQIIKLTEEVKCELKSSP